MSAILVGTCNWSDHSDFYPAGMKPAEQIGYYAERFPIVEIDSSFYRLMPARNYALWAERTPPGFVFNVKAYRELTRHGPSYEEGKRHADDDPAYDPPDEAFRAFAASIEPLREAGKLRAVHFQFPPWFRCAEGNKEHLRLCREYLPDHLLAVEFRHESWFGGDRTAETLDLLRELAMVHTVVDEPRVGSGSVPPVMAVTNPELAIVRFHGRNRETWYAKGAASSRDRFNYLYSPQELEEWAPRVHELAAQAGEVHVLMNNNYGNYAVQNATQMRDMLGA